MLKINTINTFSVTVNNVFHSVKNQGTDKTIKVDFIGSPSDEKVTLTFRKCFAQNHI